MATEVTDGVYDEGVGVPIHRARIRIAVQRRQTLVEAGDEAATSTIDLEPGPVSLHTWFDDERHRPLCGAYDAYVTREPQSPASSAHGESDA